MSDRLGSLITFYRGEARKCSRARAYLSASVMQAAAFEAALQGMCFLYPERVKKTGVYQRKRFRKTRNKALEFSLYELINIAEELSWFPSRRTSWAGKRATLAGFSHEIRQVRNFVHPGVWARKHPDTMKFTKGVYAVVYEVLDVATSWLAHRVEENLRKTIERREKIGNSSRKSKARQRESLADNSLAEVNRDDHTQGHDYR